MSMAPRLTGYGLLAARATGLGPLLLLLALLIACPIGRARAANIAHHDLASLALESELVVQARALSFDPDVRETTFEVTKVYFGDVAVGDTIVLAAGLYQLELWWGASREEREHWRPEPESVLFIRQHPHDGGWMLVGSGMRIVNEGVVYRFEQFDNPGPYLPVPQARDPYDLHRDPRAGAPLDFPRFEQQLEAALARAAAARRALAEPGSREHQLELLALIGPDPAEPERGEWPCSIGEVGDYEDLFAQTIVAALFAHADDELALEAVARLAGRQVVGVHGWRPDAFDRDRIRELASDPRRPVRHRVAALGLLDYRVSYRHWTSKGLELLADPEPHLRAAAAGLLRIDEHDQQTWQAVLARLEAEDDAAVQYAIIQQLAASPGDVELPETLWPVAIADRRGPVVRLRTALAPGWETVDVTLERADGQRVGGAAHEGSRVYTSGLRLESLSFLIDDPSALASARTGELALTLELESPGGRVTRRVSVRPMDIPLLAPTPPVGPAAAADTVPPSSVRPPGCVCTLDLAPVGNSSMPAVLVVLLVFMRSPSLRRRGFDARDGRSPRARHSGPAPSGQRPGADAGLSSQS